MKKNFNLLLKISIESISLLADISEEHAKQDLLHMYKLYLEDEKLKK